MGKVYRPGHWQPRPPGGPDGGLEGGEEPPYDGHMEHRVTALETRLDTILPTLANKADLTEVKGEVQKVGADLHKWMLATVLTVIGTMLAALIGLNQIANKSAQSAQQQPIIINVPTPQAAPAPAPIQKR
jgi:hypothetical protein